MNVGTPSAHTPEISATSTRDTSSQADTSTRGAPPQLVLCTSCPQSTRPPDAALVTATPGSLPQRRPQYHGGGVSPAHPLPGRACRTRSCSARACTQCARASAARGARQAALGATPAHRRNQVRAEASRSEARAGGKGFAKTMAVHLDMGV